MHIFPNLRYTLCILQQFAIITMIHQIRWYKLLRELIHEYFIFLFAYIHCSLCKHKFHCLSKLFYRIKVNKSLVTVHAIIRKLTACFSVIQFKVVGIKISMILLQRKKKGEGNVKVSLNFHAIKKWTIAKNCGTSPTPKVVFITSPSTKIIFTRAN